MTFVPLLAYYLVRPGAKAVERSQRGAFARKYASTVEWTLRRQWGLK